MNKGQMKVFYKEGETLTPGVVLHLLGGALPPAPSFINEYYNNEDKAKCQLED